MDEMLTPQEAANYLKISVYTVKDYARQGVLPAVKVGSVWRFPREALEQWLASQALTTGRALGASVLRDAVQTQREGIIYQAKTAPQVLLDRRRAASQALDAIRSRSKPGSIQEILDENREELRKRSQRMGE